MTNTINFSHKYAKLGFIGQKKGHYTLPKTGACLILTFSDYRMLSSFGHKLSPQAVLKSVEVSDFSKLTADFIEQDTLYYEDGKLIDVENLPKEFKTVRAKIGMYGKDKERHYFPKVGQAFKIMFKEPTNNK